MVLPPLHNLLVQAPNIPSPAAATYLVLCFEQWQILEKVVVRVIIEINDGSIGDVKVFGCIFYAGRCQLILVGRGRTSAWFIDSLLAFGICKDLLASLRIVGGAGVLSWGNVVSQCQSGRGSAGGNVIREVECACRDTFDGGSSDDHLSFIGQFNRHICFS